jgi:hypothetical protein
MDGPEGPISLLALVEAYAESGSTEDLLRALRQIAESIQGSDEARTALDAYEKSGNRDDLDRALRALVERAA